MVPVIDSARYSRDALLLLLVRQPANDRQRAILVDAVADKETYTRNKAAMIVKGYESFRRRIMYNLRICSSTRSQT